MKKILWVVLAALLVGFSAEVQAYEPIDHCGICVQARCDRECSKFVGNRVDCAKCMEYNCKIQCD